MLLIKMGWNARRRVLKKKETDKKKEVELSTPALSDDGNSFDVKAPSKDQFWSCINRLISFDDPSSRWEKTRSLVNKQVRKRNRNPSNNCAQTLAEKDFLFERVFGRASDKRDQSNVLLNVLLALEDLDRYSEASFHLFFAEHGRDRKPASDWAAQFSAGEYARLWIERSANCVPDWQVLSGEGPWSADERARFLADWLSKHKEQGEDISAIDLRRWRALFHEHLNQWRSRLPGSFLPDLLLLVEGPTDALLIPHLAGCLAVDFSELGVMVLPAGGSNQVLRRFLDLRDLTAIPMVVVVDSDAGQQAEVLADALRDRDRLHVLKSGEIEDVFADEVLVGLVNEHLKSQRLVKLIEISDLQKGGRRTQILDRLWRDRGLGSFDKIGFARTIVEKLHDPAQVPQDVVEIVESVKFLVKGADGGGKQ